jgi:hypothetical protein
MNWSRCTRLHLPTRHTSVCGSLTGNGSDNGLDCLRTLGNSTSVRDRHVDRLTVDGLSGEAADSVTRVEQASRKRWIEANCRTVAEETDPGKKRSRAREIRSIWLTIGELGGRMGNSGDFVGPALPAIAAPEAGAEHDGRW